MSMTERVASHEYVDVAHPCTRLIANLGSISTYLDKYFANCLVFRAKYSGLYSADGVSWKTDYTYHDRHSMDWI